MDGINLFLLGCFLVSIVIAIVSCKKIINKDQ